MDAGFVTRSLRTYAVVLLIFLPFGIYYLGFYRALAVLSGGVWGMVNLILLTAFITSAIRPDGIQTERAIVYGLLKFPLLYAAAYGLLKVPMFEPLWLVAGFTGILAIMALKAIGRVLLGLDRDGHKQVQSAV